MEAATTDLPSTTDTSVELCKECQKKISAKNQRFLAVRAKKICEIVDELKDFINEKVDYVWDTNSLSSHPFTQDYKSYNIGFNKHGYLSKKERFALKRDVDMFHVFKVFSLPGVIPTSATLYMGPDEYIPIKTVKLDYTGTCCFFDCPFPISAFVFESFSIGVTYEQTNNPTGFQMLKKDITIECINIKDYFEIRNKVWKKMEEKDMYKK